MITVPVGGKWTRWPSASPQWLLLSVVIVLSSLVGYMLEGWVGGNTGHREEPEALERQGIEQRRMKLLSSFSIRLSEVMVDPVRVLGKRKEGRRKSVINICELGMFTFAKELQFLEPGQLKFIVT